MSKLFFSILLFLFVVLPACEAQKEFVVVDQRELLGAVFKETTREFNNRNGSEDLEQNFSLNRQFRYAIDLKLNTNSGLRRQDVEERICETYNIANCRTGGQKQCLLPVSVPAGRAYAYEIEWTEVKREGVIREGNDPDRGNLLGTYTIVVDLQCQTVGVQVR
ncbi:MAG: hypothetical protein RML95_11005 [Anaerolineae bacterium]|nr:hypothetical protein [Anaerolineae bacterium]MDW8299851.1 hypothetical protein [Anaerolineae bacterium]